MIKSLVIKNDSETIASTNTYAEIIEDILISVNVCNVAHLSVSPYQSLAINIGL